MTRALLVMVLSLGSLLFSFRFSFRARATGRAGRGAPTAEIGHVRVRATPAHDPKSRRGRALGTLVVACLVGGVGVGLTIIVALSTLTSGMSGLLR
jgi:hypothetical protein